MSPLRPGCICRLAFAFSRADCRSRFMKKGGTRASLRSRYGVTGELSRLNFLGFLATFDRLWPLPLRANADLDLLRFGFRALGQRDLQHAVVVVCLHIIRVHGVGQRERTSE